MDPLVLLILLPVALRALLLTVAVLTAICTDSPARRKVAVHVAAMLLRPVWSRGGGGDVQHRDGNR